MNQISTKDVSVSYFLFQNLSDFNVTESPRKATFRTDFRLNAQYHRLIMFLFF